MKKILIWVWHFFSIALILISIGLTIAVLVKPELLTMTIHWLNGVIEFLWWKNYVLVGWIWIIESIPFLNIAFPGQTFMILIAWFVAQSHLILTVLIVVCAWIIWDTIAYKLWKYKWESLMRHYWPTFWLTQEWVEKLQKMTHEHAHRALFASKWNSYTRWMLPFVAGSSGMNFREFMLYNVLGSIVYGVVIVLLSRLFIWHYDKVVPYIRWIWLSVVGIVWIVYIVKYYKNERKIG
jgi:membrane-associated protein